MERVSVGVGSIMTAYFIKPIARVVSLSGMQEKVEVCYSFTGTITNIKILENEKTPDGKQDYEFVIEDELGRKIVATRSNVDKCELHSEY